MQHNAARYRGTARSMSRAHYTTATLQAGSIKESDAGTKYKERYKKHQNLCNIIEEKLIEENIYTPGISTRFEIPQNNRPEVAGLVGMAWGLSGMGAGWDGGCRPKGGNPLLPSWWRI